MNWSWDDRKAVANIAKHGVSFALAEIVFDDPMHISEPDPHPDGNRWRTIGMAGYATLFSSIVWLNPIWMRAGSSVRVRRMNMKEGNIKRVISSKLTPEMLEQSRRIAEMPDEDIDYSDIPEKRDWSNAVRGKFYRPVKKQVTLRLDADLLHWFKAQDGGKRGYQTRINAALRKYIERMERSAK